MTHFHAICTTDPMTGHDLDDRLEYSPFVVEGSHYNDLTIYFESESSKQAYLDIPIGQVGGVERLHSLIDNPTDNPYGYN
ncbi:MAG: hypothetical protein SVR94_07000 [Pseudomonadota bacterium]|nr:hypothetical protein [Pseudomonadota bacterium]